MSESLPGEETVVSSSGDDNSSSVECPTCGRDDFANVAGMKVHHSHAHNESIAGVNVKCDNCGSAATKIPSRVRKNGSNYCSWECRVENMPSGEGEDNPAYKGKVEHRCRYCNEKYKVYPVRSDLTKFCSRKCKDKWAKEHFGGENHPHSKEKVIVECEWCEDTSEYSPAEAKRRKYCSMDCKYEAHSIKLSGENHPNWIGDYESYYGPNWKRQRKKAIIRDQCRCQHCGATPIDLPREPDVHHILKIANYQRKYGSPEWYERANRLENLVTLCPKHHRMYEGTNLRPDTRSNDPPQR